MNTINLAKLGGHMNLKRNICTNKDSQVHTKSIAIKKVQDA